MREKKKLLFVSPDAELSNTVKQLLSELGIDVIVAQNHLQGLGILDKTNAQIALIPVANTNINGIDFAKIIREREKDSTVQKYIILYGNEDEKNDIINLSGQYVDDFVDYPFFEPELKWRVTRGFNYLSKIKAIVNVQHKSAELLSPDGFFFVLESEINRIVRHNSNFSIMIVSLIQFDEIVINLGEKWKSWIEENFLQYIKKKLRIYDKLSVLKENFYGILCPDTDIKGLKGLDKRIRNEYVSFFQKLRELGISETPLITHCGIAVCMKERNVNIKNVVEWVKEWTLEIIDEGCREDLFLEYEFNEDGPELIG